MNAVHPEGGSSSGGAARFSNNFDFLRFVAAAAVIVTHAYALTVGYPNMRSTTPSCSWGRRRLRHSSSSAAT